MERTFEDRVNHDYLVRMMAKHFASLGYTRIRADIDGYLTPDAIWWTNRPNEKKVPDLTCYKNDPNKTKIVLEAETCSSLKSEHTREQWELFRANASQNNGEFHVVVPRQCPESGLTGRELAKQLAVELNIALDNIWTPKG